MTEQELDKHAIRIMHARVKGAIDLIASSPEKMTLKQALAKITEGMDLTPFANVKDLGEQHHEAVTRMLARLRANLKFKKSLERNKG